MIAQLVRIRAVGVLFVLLLTGPASAADPVDAPPPKDVREAAVGLRDVYEKEYKAAESDAPAQKALACKLFCGACAHKAVAMQYTSLSEAWRLAIAGGDDKLACKAFEALMNRFRGPELAADTLKQFGAMSFAVEDAVRLLDVVTAAVKAASECEDYAGAVAFGALAVDVAKRTEKPEAAVAARRLHVCVEELKSAARAVARSSDDARANKVLGRYWALTHGRWDKGLKHLSNCDDKELAAAAKADLANPKTAKELTAVADQWYNLAKGYEGGEKLHLMRRAYRRYCDALKVATGDECRVPNSRLNEIETCYPGLLEITMLGHTSAAAVVVAAPDEKVLVSAGNDGSVRLWDVATGKLLKTLEGHTAWVGSAVVTCDGKAITAGGDNIIRVWDLKTQRLVARMEGHWVAIRGLAVTRDGKTLISGGGDKTCRAWDLLTFKEVRNYVGTDPVESVAVTPDGAYVLAGSDRGVVTVYDAKSGNVVRTFGQPCGAAVYTIAVTEDGKTALSGGRDRRIHVWELATGKEVRRFEGHTERVYQIAVSRDGKQVASASHDKTVRVWDYASGKELKRFVGHTDGVQSVCYTRNDQFLFSASWDAAVRRWSAPPAADAKSTD